MHRSCSTTRVNSDTAPSGSQNDHSNNNDGHDGHHDSGGTSSVDGNVKNENAGDKVHSKRNPNESTNPSQSADSTGTTGSFECNICLDPARDAVVSMCGHLFCWPCLHRWFETSEMRPVCPVCKAAISRDKVIPLYGRGGDHTQDPRTKIPPRPSGQRTEPDPGLGGFGNTLGSFFGGSDSNFRMSVGIGAFPFGFLATTFNFGGGLGYSNSSSASTPTQNNSNSSFSNNHNLDPNRSQSEMLWGNDSEMMSKLCLFVAIFFIGWLLVA